MTPWLRRGALWLGAVTITLYATAANVGLLWLGIWACAVVVLRELDYVYASDDEFDIYDWEARLLA
jgi:hypothetical protein